MKFLISPSLRQAEIGSREWFQQQQAMILSKPLVKRCYDLWYEALARDVASVPGRGVVLELGSGAGYLKRFVPQAITSDLTPGMADMIVDGRSLPFDDGSVQALLLTHVFHHIPDVRAFFREAQRVLLPGGVISMIECAHTPLSRLFFGKVHPEPYLPDAERWEFDAANSMLDSNQALSWIVFFRDRERFRREFPDFTLEGVRYLPWLSYLLSGGVNLRSLVPPAAAPLFRWLDDKLRPLDRLGAIHWHITIRKAAARGR